MKNALESSISYLDGLQPFKSYKNPVTSTPYKVTVMLCLCREDP